MTDKRRGRRPIIDPYRQRKHISILLPEREHADLVLASERMQLPITEIGRRAIRAYLVATMTYYYVQKDNGEFIPPATDPGFVDFKVARQVAVLHAAQVVQRRWVPTGDGKGELVTA